MGRRPNAAKRQEGAEAQKDNAQAVSTEPAMFVLAKNHGLSNYGRDHKLYLAGTAFDPATDSELISLLARSGAQFMQEPAQATESNDIPHSAEQE